MHASDLKDRAVVTLADATRVGTIDDLLFDPLYQRVVGFLIKGMTSGDVRAAVPRERVVAIGSDAVTVQSAEAFAPIDRFTELRSARTLEQARSTRVVTEGGEVLGVLDGFELDDEVREVRACILAASLLDRVLHRQDAFAPRHIRQVGEGGLIVVDNAALQGSKGEEAALPEAGAPTHPDATSASGSEAGSAQ